MAISGYEPTPLPQPDTESVPGGRRAALVVAVVAILVVGTLVWKPWESGSGAPGSPRPTTSAPAITIATFEDFAIAPTPTPQPTPSEGPIGTQNPQVAVAPGDLGSVMIDSSNGSFIYCVYGGVESKLLSLVITEPIVILTHDPSEQSQLKRVTYKPEIESNSLESVFSSDWVSLTAGPTQRRSVDGPRGLRFDTVQVNVAVGDLPTSGVVRVAVVINWIGKDGKRLATQRLYPTSYAPLGDNQVDPVPEGCPVRT